VGRLQASRPAIITLRTPSHKISVRQSAPAPTTIMRFYLALPRSRRTTKPSGNSRETENDQGAYLTRGTLDHDVPPVSERLQHFVRTRHRTSPLSNHPLTTQSTDPDPYASDRLRQVYTRQRVQLAGTVRRRRAEE